MKLFWMSLPLAVFLLGACQLKLEKLAAPAALDAPTESFSNDQLNYELVRARVLVPKCLECHSPARALRGGVNLDVYEAVLAQIDDVKESVLSGKMPKQDSLTETQKEILLRWIALGAPLNPGEDPAPKPDPSAPPEPTPAPPLPEEQIFLDFASVQKVVLGPSCVGCHDEFSPDGSLENYPVVKPQIVKIREYVVSGFMPYNSPKRPGKRVLTEEQKNLIVSWIDAGAPEFSNLPVPPLAPPVPPAVAP